MSKIIKMCGQTYSGIFKNCQNKIVPASGMTFSRIQTQIKSKFMSLARLSALEPSQTSIKINSPCSTKLFIGQTFEKYYTKSLLGIFEISFQCIAKTSGILHKFLFMKF